MTGFDIGVLVLVATGAITGFLRGFVQEVLTLFAWIVAMVAIHYAHPAVTHMLEGFVGNRMGASAVLAFAVLLLVPYAIVRLMANHLGRASRSSLLGPIDRVIGAGFGAVKGMLMVVLGFSILVLGYDTVWGQGGRPQWITQSRTYPFVNASSDALVKLLAERRAKAVKAEHKRLGGK